MTVVHSAYIRLCNFCRPSAEFRAFMGELRGRQQSPEEEEDGDLEIPRNVANDEELLTAQDVRWIYERRGLLKKRDKGEGPQHFHELIKDCQMVRNYPPSSWFGSFSLRHLRCLWNL